MGAAEFSSKTIIKANPQYMLPGKLCFFITGTSAASNDFFTVTGLTTVEGIMFLNSTVGAVAATYTCATNVITVTNASNLVWTGVVWGV